MYKSTVLILFGLFSGCKAARDSVIELKNACIENHIVELRKYNEYKDVVQYFKDSFVTWRLNVEDFGVQGYLDYQLDEAIFFSRSKRDCILILLSRTDKDSLVFGGAKIVTGQKNGNDWRFTANEGYTFDKGYFNKYENNSFANISELARYYVLMEGNPPKIGCEIDESYWFK